MSSHLSTYLFLLLLIPTSSLLFLILFLSTLPPTLPTHSSSYFYFYFYSSSSSSSYSYSSTHSPLFFDWKQQSRVCQVLIIFLPQSSSMPAAKKLTAGLVLCLLVALWSHQLSQQQPLPSSKRLLASNYTTTATRSDAVGQFCSGLTRSTLIDETLTTQYAIFNSQMAATFELDGTVLMTSLLNGNLTSVQEQVTASSTDMALFMGPFLLGLGLLLLLSPLILCCCACPSSCPPKCCRKSEEEQYSQCELYWPVGMLVAALLLCIGACIAGFSQSEMFPQSTTSVGCATSIIIDDILNGNVTTDGSSFFTGLTQLHTQLGHLSSNLTSINSTMAGLQTGAANITLVETAANTALADTAKVPNNVNSGGDMTPISYNTPLNSASPSGTTDSVFPAVLGSSTTGGYVGDLYATIGTILASVTAISTAAAGFVSEVNNFQGAVGTLMTTVQSFTTYMSDLDVSLYSTLKLIDEQSTQVHTGVRVLYGLTIVVASTMLLGTLMVAFCDKVGCRYLIYASCVMLFFIGVLGFLLSVFFSVMVPALYFGCQFMDHSLASATNFDANFGSLITDSTFRGYVSTCLPSSSGDLVTALGGGAVTAIKNLSSSLQAINGFNSSEQSTLLLTSSALMTAYISYYQTGKINDLSDSSSMAIVAQLSQPSSYSGCTGYFPTDSWVPSTQQSPVYSACQISGGSNATSIECVGANFAAATGGCSGCMDTASIFNTATYASKASVLTALNNRYLAGGCSTFNGELANTWDNYYLIKSNAYAPVSSRATTAVTSVNQLSANLTGTLNTTFTSAVTAMTTAADSVTDGKYGLVAGLNCRLVGEDFTRFTETFCQSFFTVSYFSRLVVACASFGILFSICCGACTGVRFYKQEIRKLNSIDNAGLSEDEVHDITNTNFVKPKVLE